MRRAVYVRVNVGGFDGTPPTDVVTNSTDPTHVHKLVPIHCLEERPRARTKYCRFVEARRCFAQLEERPTIACHSASVLELISCHSGEHLRRTTPKERWSGYFCVILREECHPPKKIKKCTHPCVVQ